MWLGPGGIIALVLGGWGWLWASRRTPGRPWGDWLGTALSIGALQLALPLLTAESWLVVGYHDAARVLSTTEKAIRLQLLGPSYGPLLWGAVGVLVLVGALARHRGGWGAGGPTGRTVAYGVVQGVLLAGSALCLAAFHLVFVRGGADAVNRQGAAIASEVLLTGGALAAAAALLALGWLAGRALRWART